jgi:hypothetical protein
MPEQLLHRSNSGIEVDVLYVENGTIALAVGVNGVSASTIVPQDRVLDAFEHPFVYLSDDQVDRLFPRVPSAF